MPTENFKTRLLSLKFSKKLIYFASGLTIISVFMPWYNDVDKFKIGDSFLGITGPLYLAGFIVLIASILSFGIITLELKGKKLPKLPLKKEHFFIFNSSLSLLMLTLCASVYFHTKFGINLTDKSAGAGLTMAFLMSSLSLVGGILTNKKDGISFETEGSLEPLINLKEDRQKQNLEAQKEITVGEAMEKDLEDLYPNKVAAHQSGPSPQQNNNNTVQQSAEDKKLWGWGHGINNNKR